MEIRALAKGVRVSPQKAGLVANLVRGKDVGIAMDILSFSKQKSAKLINGKIKVEFDYAASGLVLENINRTEFEVAAKDKKFHPASAINKNTYLNSYIEICIV